MLLLFPFSVNGRFCDNNLDEKNEVSMSPEDPLSGEIENFGLVFWVVVELSEGRDP